MERLVTVEFGPSRSKRFPQAVAEARSGGGEWSELEPGRYRVRFVLGEDAAAYADLARLLERVRHWRATEVDEDDELVSTFHAREMAWCADSQLSLFGACRFHFYYGSFRAVHSVPCSMPNGQSGTCWARTYTRRRCWGSRSARQSKRC